MSLGFGRSLAGGFRSLAAGEVPEFTQAIDEARRGALFRMIEHAKRLGANAVVGVRFDSNTLGDSGGLGELVAYGSAVVVKTRLTREGRPAGRPFTFRARRRYALTAPCPSQNALSAFCVFASQMNPPTIGNRVQSPVTPVTGGGS